MGSEHVLTRAGISASSASMPISSSIIPDRAASLLARGYLGDSGYVWEDHDISAWRAGKVVGVLS